MKHLINILKGIAIGIANVIPGFSGGTMAVMLNVYDLFVSSFANIFNDFKNVVKKGWSLFLGIALGILLALITIVKLLEIIPFITIMFFVGLLLGSLFQIFNKSKEGKLHFRDIISFIIAIIIIVALPLINTNNSEVLTYDFKNYIIVFILGIISASSMVIPGVSGSLVLMAFGYYVFVMNTLKDLLNNIFNFSYNNYLGMLLTILCFAIGCVIGLVFVSKLIIKMMKRYPKTVYFTILGLLVASPFSIIYKTLQDYNVKFDVMTIVFSIISFIIGVAIVLLGEYYSKKIKGGNKND
ncbi:MAG: DUF368 domain-containing protein [Erysipelotrichaceae bacterium]|nr:DUF368 domain-containing protein [Erysipelotrichaceae bacterium]